MSKIGGLVIELQEHGFKTIEEAEANGYELVGGVLYKTADKALQEEREEILDKIDEVIAYLKEECDDDTCERPTFMIGNLREVEKFIQERY